MVEVGPGVARSSGVWLLRKALVVNVGRRRARLSDVLALAPHLLLAVAAVVIAAPLLLLLLLPPPQESYQCGRCLG